MSRRHRLFVSAKLSFLEKHDAIEEVYFCYVLPTSLSSNDVDVRNDDVVYDSPSSFHVHSSAMHKQVNVNDKKLLSNKLTHNCNHCYMILVMCFRTIFLRVYLLKDLCNMGLM